MKTTDLKKRSNEEFLES
jgi:hypothetical protein